MMKKAFVSCLALVAGLAGSVSAQDNPFVGRWALDIPGVNAGWLGITEQYGALDAQILWGGGSVLPVDGVGMAKRDEGDPFLLMNRLKEVEVKDKQGKVVDKNVFATSIMGRVENGELQCIMFDYDPGSKKLNQVQFTGTRMADLPPAPDLSKVKYGDPIELFNGKDLSGWKLVEEGATSGWSVQDGLLVNNPVQKPGQHIQYGNLRTEKEFEDFNLTLETNVEKDQNSGVYLRGVYEVQVTDSYGKPLDPHNMGGVYSRITPTEAAEKPAGEWQTMDLTLCDQHITVILNGKKIIDNQPVEGPTGGALWSDVTKPGPIYVQGDHTGVKYRNIVLKPILK